MTSPIIVFVFVVFSLVAKPGNGLPKPSTTTEEPTTTKDPYSLDLVRDTYKHCGWNECRVLARYRTQGYTHCLIIDCTTYGQIKGRCRPPQCYGHAYWSYTLWKHEHHRHLDGDRSKEEDKEATDAYSRRRKRSAKGPLVFIRADSRKAGKEAKGSEKATEAEKKPPREVDKETKSAKEIRDAKIEGVENIESFIERSGTLKLHEKDHIDNSDEVMRILKRAIT